MILRVGLTGGIASGKSTILRMFAGLGCRTADADAIVARLYQPGQAGHEAVVRTYGEAILLPDGQIDRRKLASIAFSSPSEAGRLNTLIHPLVLAEEARMMRDAEAREDDDVIYIVEATLLLEAGGRDRYDRIVVVDVPPEVQIARALGRGMALEDVRSRIEHQMPREERLRQADYVIHNSGDERNALAEVTRVYERLQQDLSMKQRPGR